MGHCLDSTVARVTDLVVWIARLVATQPAEWITAASTALLMIIAAIQFRAINRTSAADFVHRLNGDFYALHTRKVRELLIHDAVTFQIDKENPRFVDRGGVVAFDAHDLDDYVLGPLEAIGIYESQKIIDLATTYEMFGWYVTKIWESGAIRDYIQWQREQPHGFDVYDCLGALYKKCVRYRDVKQRKSIPTSNQAKITT